MHDLSIQKNCTVIPGITLLFLVYMMSKSKAFQCTTLNIESVKHPGNTFDLILKWTRALPLGVLQEIFIS